jgi:hypothetical protein
VTTGVVLVRPWVDAHGGAGCCGGDAGGGICLDGGVDGPREHDAEVGLVAETYLRLREELPDVDVQIVGANNTAFLLPAVFRSVRRRRGTLAALRALNRATTGGSVLVDGERVGDVAELGPEGTLAAVRHLRRAGHSS